MLSPVHSSNPAAIFRTAGIDSGIERAGKAADDIAGLSAQDSKQSPIKLGTALVELKQGERQVAASAAVISTADQVLGTLLDIQV